MEMVCLKYSSKEEFREQFEMCFKQHFKPLCFYAMSFVRDDEVARDIVHDVFLSVWKRRDEIDFSQPIYPYFLSLTRNCALNYLAHQRVKSRHQEWLLKTGDWYMESNDSSHEELIRRIIERMDLLPGRCAEVMRLCFIECKKYKEIADLLHISVNTVKTHITTGLRTLRDEFPASSLLLFFFSCLAFRSRDNKKRL